CGIYDLFGCAHSLRTLDEVKDDIRALKVLHGDCFETAFLGDANPLALPADFLVETLTTLRTVFLRLKRVTAYGRASSVWKKSQAELDAIHAAGLDRLHVGMESGSDAVLRMQKKGTSQDQLIEAGNRVKASGMELSYYLLLGLGGQTLWQDHVEGSVQVINAVKPHFVRVRRLWTHPASRLGEKIASGEFIPQTPEGTVIELRDILRGLDAPGTTFTCDHANNYIQVHGALNDQKQAMLVLIERFLALPDEIRQDHYASMPSVI
ncbi:MAG: radical SAM protein, partial [Syntrophaceae bacterium]